MLSISSKNPKRSLLSFLPREGRLWLLLAGGLFLAGWFKGINLLMLLAYLLLALWIVNWISASVQLRRVRAKRLPLGPFFSGQEAYWDVELTSERRFGSSGWRLVDSGPDHWQQWFVDRLPAKNSVRMRGSAVFDRRGRYLFHPLQARCLHPFGLVQRRRDLLEAQEVLVLPRLGELAMARFQRWLARMVRGDGRLFRVAKPSMIQQDDLHGLRQFRPGDNPRWIHWRTTARRGEKMVREFEESAGQSLLVIMDPWSENHEHFDPNLEAAISLASTICWEWCRERHDYLLLGIAGGDPEVVSGYTSRDNALQSLQALARLSAQGRVDPAPLVQLLSRTLVPSAPVLLIGQRPNSALAQALSGHWHRPVIMLQPAAAGDFYKAPTPTPSRKT
jgi:uncharacterized protein (DUF58 family)